MKPAPVQVTWIGFWGTTGLSTMDYILSDSVSILPGEELYYSERVVRLPNGRLCYDPPDYAPQPALPPSLRSRTITFGSFNYSAKIRPEVIRVWSEILRTVPGSRLLLKWKTFSDASVRRRLTEAFAAEGIPPDQLELRGASPHPAMLAEYSDIDVALDPFPFSGGLTSCEALWMGLPVITLPGAGAASRQTQGFLQVLGLTKWTAASSADYVEIAATLASDTAALVRTRQTLRPRMAASPLCDGRAFALNLETAFRQMWRNWCDTEAPKEASAGAVPAQRTFLHVGCGPARKGQTSPEFAGPRWRELRLDIDPAVEPDIVGTITDMATVPTESVDALYSSHNIEHLFVHEVPQALGEFLRVLKPDGFAIITCPDLKSVAALIAADKLTEVAYVSPAGPITPLDILYGYRPALAAGNLFMAHRCGFTRRTLESSLLAAGFGSVTTWSRAAPTFDLWAVATKSKNTEAALRALAALHRP